MITRSRRKKISSRDAIVVEVSQEYGDEEGDHNCQKRLNPFKFFHTEIPGMLLKLEQLFTHVNLGEFDKNSLLVEFSIRKRVLRAKKDH